MTADIDGSINAIFMTGDLVSILKVIQSDEDGEASWSSMTITHLVVIVIVISGWTKAMVFTELNLFLVGIRRSLY